MKTYNVDKIGKFFEELNSLLEKYEYSLYHNIYLNEDTTRSHLVIHDENHKPFKLSGVGIFNIDESKKKLKLVNLIQDKDEIIKELKIVNQIDCSDEDFESGKFK